MNFRAAPFATFFAGLAVGAFSLFVLERSAGPARAETPPPVERPAYLVVLGEVYDADAFAKNYVAKLGPIYAKYGGTYLAAGHNFATFEGEAGFKSYVISKWPSMQAARAFWDSPEYAPLKQARIDNNWGRFDVFALEGLPEKKE